jgi:hypothetical protein
VRLHRQSEEIDLSSKNTPIKELVSRVLRPARWAKEALVSNESSH